MRKANNSKWKVTPLTVNIKQKQWRQDFRAFIRNKLFWDGTTLVTRSKAKSKEHNLATKGIKTFEVYNAYGGSVKVEYQKENEILYTSHEELLKQYFAEKNINFIENKK